MNYKFNNLRILNKPEKIYLKYDNNKDYTIIPKINEYIYKCSIVAHTKGDIKECIYSPISGRLLETIKENDYKYLILENDFKEINDNLKGINKSIVDIKYEDYINKLATSGIYNQNKPIYLNYIDSFKKYLIIDCLDNSILLSKFLLKNNIEELLETIDAMIEINKLKECFFLIDKKDKELKKILEQKIGTYLNIKIIKISLRKKEKKITLFKKKNKLEENNIIMETINNIFNIKNVLKYNIPFIEKFVIIKKGKNILPIRVKNGTKLSYVLKELSIENDKDIIIDNDIDEITL